MVYTCFEDSCISICINHKIAVNYTNSNFIVGKTLSLYLQVQYIFSCHGWYCHRNYYYEKKKKEKEIFSEELSRKRFPKEEDCLEKSYVPDHITVQHPHLSYNTCIQPFYRTTDINGVKWNVVGKKNIPKQIFY